MLKDLADHLTTQQNEAERLNTKCNPVLAACASDDLSPCMNLLDSKAEVDLKMDMSAAYSAYSFLTDADAFAKEAIPCWPYAGQDPLSHYAASLSTVF